MRIAILLCGHLRTFRQTKDSFLNAFGKYNPDVFCHTWNTQGHSDRVWWTHNGDEFKNDITTKEVMDEVCSIYNPVKLVVNTQTNFVSEKELYNTIGGYNATKNQWETIYKCNELKKQYEEENNFKYDLVIKTRFDILYKNEFDITYENNSIYFLPTPHSIHHKLYADSLFYSDSITMDNISGLRNTIENYFDLPIKEHGIIEGEVPFTYYLRDNNLFGYENKYSTLKCSILRGDGQSLPLY